MSNNTNEHPSIPISELNVIQDLQSSDLLLISQNETQNNVSQFISRAITYEDIFDQIFTDVKEQLNLSNYVLTASITNDYTETGYKILGFNGTVGLYRQLSSSIRELSADLSSQISSTDYDNRQWTSSNFISSVKLSSSPNNELTVPIASLMANGKSLGDIKIPKLGKLAKKDKINISDIDGKIPLSTISDIEIEEWKFTVKSSTGNTLSTVTKKMLFAL